MSQTVIDINHLSKRYRIGKIERYQTLRETITDIIKTPFHHYDKNQTKQFIWALKDVNLKIKKGDVVGIIGPNGAGKSTLLKILARITEPTHGQIKIIGRVGSLLEVGTGFHLELTGRENIYLNGAVLGMSKAEIEEKFDDIVEFAGTKKFLDTPLKHYSSGMYLRLAFAVAAHLDPEILLVDEVLAVGDIEFQKKCLGKISDIAKEGRTVLFVSHNLQAVSTLTSKAIYLKSGKVVYFGKTNDAINHYIHENKDKALIYEDKSSITSPKITKVKLYTSFSNNVQKNGDKLIVEIHIKTLKPIKGVCLSFQITDDRDQNYIHLWTFDSELPMCRLAGTNIVRCTIPKLRLYMGKYFLKLYLSEPPGGEQFQYLEHICPFEVVMYGKHREFPWYPQTCAYLEEAKWKII